MTYELDRAREHQEGAQWEWESAHAPAPSEAQIHHQEKAALYYAYARLWVETYHERITPEWQARFESIEGVPVRRPTP